MIEIMGMTTMIGTRPVLSGRLVSRWLACIALALIIVGAYTASAQSDPVVVPTTWQDAVIVVNSTADTIDADGACTLRAALASAHADSAIGGCTSGLGAETLDLTALSGVIMLESALPPITSSLALIGAGAADLTIMRAADAPEFRILTIDGGAVLLGDLTISGGVESVGGGVLVSGGDVTLQGVTVRASYASSSGGGIALIGGALRLTVGTLIRDNGAESSGGGLYHAGGALHLSDSTIADNTAGSSGGGLYSSAEASIVRSAIYGNVSESAGGGIAHESGTLALVSSTISGNQARYGGAIYTAGTIRADGVTIADNQAANTGGVLNTGAFTFANTILSDNSGGDCGGAVESGGYNLIDDAANCQIAGETVGNIVGESATLSPLALHGGLTPVQLPSIDSLARDAGDPDGCAATDQRGARIAGRCDIGAADDGALAIITWIAASSGSWHTASNWSGGVVPGVSDEVTLDVPAAVTVTISASVSVNRITSREHLQHTSGTLTVAAATVFEGAYTMSGGIFTGAGTRLFTGAFSWNGGTLSGTGAMTNDGAMTAASITTRTLTGGATFTNNTQVTWTGGDIRLDEGATFTNAIGAVFNAHGGGQLTTTAQATAGQFVNNGDFLVTGGIAYPAPGGTDGAQGSFGNGQVFIIAPFINGNNGSVVVTGGILFMRGTSSSSGSFSGDVRFDNTATRLTLLNGAVMDGTTISGGAIVTTAANATVTGTGVVISNGSLTQAATSALTLTDTTISGGTLDGGTLNGVTAWSGGTLSGTVTLNGTVNAAASGAGSMTFAADAAVTSFATFNWSSGYLTFYDNAVFTNTAFGQFNDTVPVGVLQLSRVGSGLAPSIRNFGTITATSPLVGGDGVNPINVILENNSVFTGILGRTATLASGAGVNMNGTTIQGNGRVSSSNGSVNGTVTFNGGEVGGTVTFNGTVNINGPGGLRLTDNASMNNAGTINWSGGTITFLPTAALTNLAGGTINITVPGATGGELANGGGTPIGLVNYGAINAPQPLYAGAISVALHIGSVLSGTLRSGTYTLMSAPITMNNVTLHQDGNTILAGTGTIDGTIAWNAGSWNGSFSIASGSTVTMGTTSNKTIGAGGALTNNGTITWNSGQFTFGNGAALTNAAGATFNAASPVYQLSRTTSGAPVPTFDNFGTINATQTLNGGNPPLITLRNGSSFTGSFATALTIAQDATVSMHGATLFNSAASLTGNNSIVTGTITNNGGTLAGSPIFEGTLNLSVATTTVAASGTITSSGTVNWTGGSIILNNQAQWINGTTGVFNVQIVSSGFTMFELGTPLGFFNQGTFNANPGGTTPLAIYFPFANSGTLNLQANNLNISSFTHTAGAINLVGGSLNSSFTLAGGTLTGTGTITGNLTNAATINVGNAPGTLTITGNYTQTAAGTLRAQIGGTIAGTGYDRLAVSGAATLAGTLDLALINAFSPAIGNAFEVLAFASRTGTFTSVTGTAIGGGKAFSPAYSATRVTINTVAFP